MTGIQRAESNTLLCCPSRRTLCASCSARHGPNRACVHETPTNTFPFPSTDRPAVSKKTSATAEKKPEPVAKKGSEHAKAPINAKLSRDEKIELHRKMVRIRRFEERSLRAYQS